LSSGDNQTELSQSSIDKRDSNCSPRERQKASKNAMAAGESGNLDVVKVTWSQLTDLVGKRLNECDDVARNRDAIEVEGAGKDQSVIGQEKERHKDLSGTKTKKELHSVGQENSDDLDEWESQWDDNGECLEDSAMAELTARLKDSHIDIKTPKPNYYNFDITEAELDADGWV
jgi:hypothetical protein